MNQGDKRSKKVGVKSGFTIIELMLAMSFISVLLVTIAMTIIQVGVIYNRGLALKEVNQVARDIASDIRRTAIDALELNPGTDFVTSATGGRMCLGTYSYVWNTTMALQSSTGSMVNNRTRYESDTSKLVHFVKVPDTARIYCQKAGANFAFRDIRSVDRASSQELLDGGEYNLSLIKVSLPTPPASASVTSGSATQTLFSFSYTISAGDVSAIDTSKPACLEPSVFGANTTYCNVQEFTLVFRIGNRV